MSVSALNDLIDEVQADAPFGAALGVAVEFGVAEITHSPAGAPWSPDVRARTDAVANLIGLDLPERDLLGQWLRDVCVGLAAERHSH